MGKFIINNIIIILMMTTGCAIKSSHNSLITVFPASYSITSSSESIIFQTKTIINWQDILLPMIKHMLSVNDVNIGSSLLINTVKNNTNGKLQVNEITATLINIFLKTASNYFSVISSSELEVARQKLGLSTDDCFESRSKAIGLARYLNAQYILYSIADGNVKKPNINLQLMSVLTGEIIWSSENMSATK